MLVGAMCLPCCYIFARFASEKKQCIMSCAQAKTSALRLAPAKRNTLCLVCTSKKQAKKYDHAFPFFPIITAHHVCYKLIL